MMEKIYKRLDEMNKRPHELRKTFSFNMEDLQDKPEICLKEIKDYLDLHGDKIDDFRFESYVDEETFKPMLIMHILLNEEWQKMIVSNGLWENLIPATRKVESLREQVRSVMELYLYEINDATTRKQMAMHIQSVITIPGKDVEVIDITTNEDVDANRFSYVVRDGENEIGLDAYIDFLSDI
jgi:hypothetical protein